MKILRIIILCCMFIIGSSQNAHSFTGDADVDIVSEVNNIPNSSGHYIYAQAGFSQILSSVTSLWTSGDARLGPNWQVGYDWISDKKIGAGFLYSGYTSKGKVIYPINGGLTWGQLSTYWMLQYFAPQFVTHLPLGSGRWGLRLGVGVGMMMSSELYSGRVPKGTGLSSSYNEYGVGCNLNVGVNFRLSDHLSIIGSLSNATGYFKQENQYLEIGDSDKVNGVSLLMLSFGISYHF